MSSGRIQQRIDPSLQEKAEAVLKALGIKPAQAITLFYMEITKQMGLPFHPTKVQLGEIPNARLRKELRKTEREAGVKAYKNKQDFFDALHKL